MTISKHIYNYDSEYPRIIIINHGGSETQVLYDSNPPKEKEKEKTNLQKWLQEAKDNDDL